MTEKQTKRISLKKKIEALQNFNSSDEIADFLRSKKIKGVSESFDSCPIAEWLKKGLRTSRISVLSYEIQLDTLRDEEVQYWDNSEAVREFIKRFDEGDTAFDDLREKASE